MLTLYDDLSSGNCYKVRLLLHQLGRPYRRVALDIDKGETRTADFLAKNPDGRVPALELADGRILAQSDAILWYLADGSGFLPADPFQRAQVLQWMFFEQYSHEPYVAVARYILQHLPADSPRRGELPKCYEKGAAALAVMEAHLERQRFFVGGRYSIADIALYAYSHVAGEGGFDLAPYPALQDWFGRIAAQPGHIAITEEAP
jgi:glutathione S-transferase